LVFGVSDFFFKLFVPVFVNADFLITDHVYDALIYDAVWQLAT
jgi:hypothetical protein